MASFKIVNIFTVYGRVRFVKVIKVCGSCPLSILTGGRAGGRARVGLGNDIIRSGILLLFRI